MTKPTQRKPALGEMSTRCQPTFPTELHAARDEVLDSRGGYIARDLLRPLKKVTKSQLEGLKRFQ